MKINTKAVTAALMASSILAAPAVYADSDYPTRDITMIVGYSAGGGTDVMARTVAPFLEEYLGGNVNITVENRPGAGGELGFTAIAQAEPDGYTIGMLNSPSFINPLIQREPEYTLDSFQPIGNIVTDATSVVVRADSEFETLQDFIDYVEANPGAMPVGNSSLGGATHTSFLRFLAAEDLQVTHVPFPGAAPSRTALLGGHVAASVMGIGEAGPYHLEGDLRILGTMAAERWEEVPEVPTFSELGFPIVAGSDRGLAAPAGIPDDIRDKLVDAVAQMIEDPDFRQAARDQVLPLNYMAPDDYREQMQNTLDEMQAIWDENPWAS